MREQKLEERRLKREWVEMAVCDPMIDMTYDPDADAAYIYFGRGKVAATKEEGPFLYDVDASGKILEILSASRVLAPGDWSKSRLPGSSAADAAE